MVPRFGSSVRRAMNGVILRAHIRTGARVSSPRYEMNSLKEIGKFRVIPGVGPREVRLRRKRQRMEKDIRPLARQSAAQNKTLEISKKKTLRVGRLRKAGHRLLKKTNSARQSAHLTTALVKPREVKTHADLYRSNQKRSCPGSSALRHPVRCCSTMTQTESESRICPARSGKKTRRTARGSRRNAPAPGCERKRSCADLAWIRNRNSTSHWT